jgi:hypothetical protein
VPREGSERFFFEKKNQKTFPRWHPAKGESLFASFSSEKEESCLLSVDGVPNLLPKRGNAAVAVP